jgi:hypothetical protein
MNEHERRCSHVNRQQATHKATSRLYGRAN